jgi:NADP-dependent 3-hydroxy acid dehydrogenase YdfG
MSRLIVTGAASGIGAEVARQAKAAGWKVMGLDRDFAESSRGTGQYSVDIRDPQSVSAALEDAMALWEAPPGCASSLRGNLPRYSGS